MALLASGWLGLVCWVRSGVVVAVALGCGPWFGVFRGVRAGCRLGYPVATAVFRRVSMVMARARISRFAEAIATWSRFRFFASPR